MPSFDVVSQADEQEIKNAADQARREVATRFDLKDAKAEVEFGDDGIKIAADGAHAVNAITDVVIGRLVRRGVDPLFFDRREVEEAPGGRAKRLLALKQGIPQDLAKQIAKEVKAQKLKVQVEIRGDELRISGKKRDDLQATIRTLKALSVEQPLQFVNFRD